MFTYIKLLFLKRNWKYVHKKTYNFEAGGLKYELISGDEVDRLTVHLHPHSIVFVTDSNNKKSWLREHKVSVPGLDDLTTKDYYKLVKLIQPAIKWLRAEEKRQALEKKRKKAGVIDKLLATEEIKQINAVKDSKDLAEHLISEHPLIRNVAETRYKVLNEE